MPEAGTDAEPACTKRDALGQTCFLLHIAVMVFIVAGWALPPRSVLLFYLVFVPAVTLHWQCNRGTCVLNNLESLIRTGRWRNASNPEEGAWLRTLLKDTLGLQLPAIYFDALIYGALLAFWGLAGVRLLRA